MAYGVAFNYPNYVCTECIWHGWVIFIFLGIAPVVILMILLATLHTNITNGALNGFVLYSQLVSLQFPGLGYISWVHVAIGILNFSIISITCSLYIPILLIVHSMWNLKFLTLVPVPIFCLPLVDTAAEVILLQYVIAVCPLVFILVTYTWIRWYNNGYRFVVYTTRPIHQLLGHFWQKFKIHPLLVDTYAGLMLLSFMRILDASIKLLHLTTLDYIESESNNKATNIFLCIVAVLCLLVFVVPLMTILLFYHLKLKYSSDV